MKTIDFLKERNVDIDAALELLGDEDFYNETLNDFYTSSEERKQQLETFKNNNDTENYGILAHSIKSDCKYLGFMKLADTSYQHELAGKGNDMEFINNNYDSYINEYNSIIDLIKEYLEG